MTPEGVAALSAVIVAAVGAGPAYLGLVRQIRGAAQDQSAATRDAASTTIAAIERLNGRVDELRHDIRDVREWQTSHTAEHVLIRHNHIPSTGRDSEGNH
jgi:hypothetical protein